ncbi:MAG: heme NO-binding domain-containing protein [Minwuiales bacterium]|nr:heme NO-binding domain-containing protein [Minwuiales bacterium]
MKGFVFTEFLEMVDDKFSPDLTERIVDQADVPSGCAYTAVGTYDHMELVQLVVGLSKETGTAAPDLVKAFGAHLLSRFVVLYPEFFDGHADPFTFLESVENYIHIEVKKLYPDATLPSVACERPSPDKLVVLYESERCLADAAHGLIEGCLKHFGAEDQVTLTREDLSSGKSSRVRFELTR